MINYVKHGPPKIQAVVLHGGPGAPGYMAPVARELSRQFGVLEPYQTKDSLEGQIVELRNQISEVTDDEVCLIGSSWGATLALFYAARYSNVSKVILIGSCVYDEDSSKKVKELRFSRMSDNTKDVFETLNKLVAENPENDELFAQLADCFFDSDTFEPFTRDLEVEKCQKEINLKVWNDFKKIRDSKGELAKIFSNIKCPVLNIHGSYDPHIIEGIQPFLESCIKNIELKILDQCGHYPWIEKHAKDEFFKILRNELSNCQSSRK